MAYLVRCPVSYCGCPKRIDAGEVDPRVGCPRTRCPRCHVPYVTWPPKPGVEPRLGEAHEDWGA